MGCRRAEGTQERRRPGVRKEAELANGQPKAWMGLPERGCGHMVRVKSA